MTYAEFYPIATKLTEDLECFALDTDSVNNYLIAKAWIDKLRFEIATVDSDVRESIASWVKRGGTVLLKSVILPKAGFDFNDNAHFNAFAFLDSFSATQG